MLVFFVLLLFGPCLTYSSQLKPKNLFPLKQQSFTIDYENNCFLKDGVPFKYYSGSLHYFRVPPEYWPQRLADLKAAGLDAVQTYIEWSTIEKKKNTFDVSGINNFIKFIKISQEQGLLVILRLGPYICAERDFGGFPAWLQWEKGIEFRTNNTVYMNAVENFFNFALPMLRPFLYENGGPVIMVQIENEYGSFGANDAGGLEYKLFLRDLFRKHLGQNIVLFTVDGHYPGYVEKGQIPGVYPTIDFGAGDNITLAVEHYRRIHPKGPLVNSEFYTGWLDHWGEDHQTVATDKILGALQEMDKFNFSVNFYMFYGGTNFGFTNGANYFQNYTPVPTSYDYDSPLSEDGTPTSKYYKIASFIKRHHKKYDNQVSEKYHNFVERTRRIGIPKVELFPVGNIFDSSFQQISDHIHSENPLSFEDLRQADGFVLYTTILNNVSSVFDLKIDQVSDRALIYLDEKFVGKISRSLGQKELKVTLEETPKKLQIFVENQGRVGFGDMIGEKKGILSDVLVNGNVQTNWTQSTLPRNWKETCDFVEVLSTKTNLKPMNRSGNIPTFFVGYFKFPTNDPFNYSSFLSFKSGPWHKGLAFINKQNIGRYWPYSGPQKNLYVPGVYFKPKPKMNEIILFELENSNCQKSGCFVDFDSRPDIDSPVRPD